MKWRLKIMKIKDRTNYYLQRRLYLAAKVAVSRVPPDVQLMLLYPAVHPASGPFPQALKEIWKARQAPATARLLQLLWIQDSPSKLPRWMPAEDLAHSFTFTTPWRSWQLWKGSFGRQRGWDQHHLSDNLLIRASSVGSNAPTSSFPAGSFLPQSLPNHFSSWLFWRGFPCSPPNWSLPLVLALHWMTTHTHRKRRKIDSSPGVLLGTSSLPCNWQEWRERSGVF